MKKIIKILWLPTIVLSVILMVVACEETVDTYSDYTKDGETVYVGTPDTVIVAHGFEKLEFTVAINADPKIKKGVLQTIDGSFTHDFDVVRNNVGKDTIKFVINLDQGEYTFKILLKDDAGNESVPHEVNTVVYGGNYANALLSRSVGSIKASSNSAAIIWGDPAPGTLSTTLMYEDATGTMQTLEIPNDVTETTIDSYKVGGEIKIVSLFKPTENAFETFSSSVLAITFPDKYALDFAGITALRLPFDASDGCYGSTYERLTNGATGEFWHSCDTPEDSYPFVMSFDLGVTAKVRGFRLDERSGCCGSRSPADYQIWATNDIVLGATTLDIDAGTIADWEADAAAKGWVKLLDVTGNTNTTFETNIEAVDTNYRYVRVVAIASIDGGGTANFDEFTFFASETN